MSASCVTCDASRISCCAISRRVLGSLYQLASKFTFNQGFAEKIKLSTSSNGKCLGPLTIGFVTKRTGRNSQLTVHAFYGDNTEDSSMVFPRIRVRDPYQLLGISKEASQEEIQAARNFLVKKYAGHQPSVDAIESAHNKILMQSLYDRKKPKLNLKKKVSAITESRVIKAISGRFEAPSTKFIIKAAIAFLILGVFTILFPTEEGPTLQVAISLMVSVYFIHDRLRSWLRAWLYGIGAFFGSWLFGTFLMVSVIPPLIKGPRSLEVGTSLISYVLLWVSSTYLK